MEFTLYGAYEYGAYELDGFSQHKLRRARSFRRAGGLFHAVGRNDARRSSARERDEAVGNGSRKNTRESREWRKNKRLISILVYSHDC
jgi:hypothetical protein